MKVMMRMKKSRVIPFVGAVGEDTILMSFGLVAIIVNGGTMENV